MNQDVRLKLHTTQQWLEYFRANRNHLIPIPFDEPYQLSQQQRTAISASIAEFQLGEQSEGRHLMHFAREHAARTGDLAYVETMALFIAEENRHARGLARVMDNHGIKRKQRTVADGVFRFVRKLAGLELSITVLVTAEIIAQVYYRALRDATGCPALCTLCKQILRDERMHVAFQCQRLANLRWRSALTGLNLRRLVHRAMMLAAIIVVWINHGKALRQGNMGWRRFWKQCWIRFTRADRYADPRTLKSDLVLRVEVG